jgi:hypothetical protein
MAESIMILWLNKLHCDLVLEVFTGPGPASGVGRICWPGGQRMYEIISIYLWVSNVAHSPFPAHCAPR